MYLIVGLGNPEKEYANTRHNMGFNVINKIAKQYKIDVTENKFEGLLWMGQIEGEKVILLKPQTYMNDSGKSVIKAKNFYKIPEENVLVIYDDIDLDLLIDAIRKLDDKLKSVIAYKVYYDLTADEIAQIMGISKRTVFNYLNKAKRQILDLIGGDRFE